MQKYSCCGFELAIQERMDQRLPIADDIALNRHAEECPQCAELFMDFQSLEQGLLSLAWSASPDSIAADLPPLNKSPIGDKQLKHGRFGFLGIVLSIAAVLMISLSFSNLSNDTPVSPMAKRDAGTSQVKENPAPLKRLLASAPSDQKFSFPADQIRLVSWHQLSRQLHTSVYYRISAELPGVRPLHSSIDLTVDLLQQTFGDSDSASSDERPDLGFRSIVVNRRA